MFPGCIIELISFAEATPGQGDYEVAVRESGIMYLYIDGVQ